MEIVDNQSGYSRAQKTALARMAVVRDYRNWQIEQASVRARCRRELKLVECWLRFEQGNWHQRLSHRLQANRAVHGR